MCPWSLALASSIPVLGLESVCPRKGCPWPWPRIFFVSLALASSLVSSTPPLVFSTIDLKSAYHQVPIREHEKKYTAFEANKCLYQFCHIPFGVTNGVAAFQRIMNSFIADEGLSDTFAYLDNVTICGENQTEHNKNLHRFLDAAKRKNLVYNEKKCTFATLKLNVLGSVICDGVRKPDLKASSLFETCLLSMI